MATRDTPKMRIKAEDRSLIDWAAKAHGKTRTDFILKAARRAAEDTMFDRWIVAVGSEAHEVFLARLDSPLLPSERLIRILRTKAPWA